MKAREIEILFPDPRVIYDITVYMSRLQVEIDDFNSFPLKYPFGNYLCSL